MALLESRRSAIQPACPKGELLMLHERDATRLWQKLFRGQAVTSQTLVEAASLVEDLHPESPLRFRLLTELEELRGLHQAPEPKKKRRNTATDGQPSS